MGEQRVSTMEQSGQMQNFVKHLLKDVRALQYMLDNDWFESGIARIGAEQELCLIDRYCKPAPVAMDLLARYKEPWLETELGKFNLELNLIPRELTGNCFLDMENELRGYLTSLQENLDALDTRLILTGILPTFKKSDLDFHNLTPNKRYAALMNALRKLRGEAYQLNLVGIDELSIKHDTALLEACNTSFQVHLQVDPSNFVKMYNIAQAVTAPVMAMAANSPLLFGKRLWHETRIAVFQQSIDNRISRDYIRDHSPRVTFGHGWVDESILDIYKEDILRFRVILSSEVEEDALSLMESGKTPRLRALQVHNSTVYRWNRPCYGISPNGKPHLRIENRVLPSGPTIIDEMANAAFWIGLMKGMEANFNDIRDHIGFEDIQDNFIKAARTGIDTKFTWFKDRKVNVCDLVKEELLPIARQGLESHNVPTDQIDRYLNVIAGRTEQHMNGARWMLRGFTHLAKETTRDEALSTLTAAIIKQQTIGNPVHEWEMPSVDDFVGYETTRILAEEMMDTEVFTVRQDDVLELVADMMDWQDVRYTAVENESGILIGLVSHNSILRHFSDPRNEQYQNLLVADVMVASPIVIKPRTTITEAMNLMEKNKIGCLPVVNEEGYLLGIITEKTFLKISRRLMQRLSNRFEA